MIQWEKSPGGSNRHIVICGIIDTMVREHPVLLYTMRLMDGNYCCPWVFYFLRYTTLRIIIIQRRKEEKNGNY